MGRLFIGFITVFCLFSGCSVNTEKCLKKEGFKNCDDLRAAAQKAVGSDEAYRFLSIAKKCGCTDP
jgi:hypothetical protein